MAMHLNVIGSSPAWPNPGGAHSGYLLEAGGRRLLLDCGPGVLSRLRQREGWPRIDAVAITHFHLDHWGDLVPWVWGSMYRSQEENVPKPELWVYEGGRHYLEALGTRLGFPDMFDRAFVLHEYRGEEQFQVAGFDVLALRLPHSRSRRTASGSPAPASRLRTRATRRRATRSLRWPRTPTCSSARRRSSAVSSTATSGATSTWRRRSPPIATPAPTGSCSRIARRSCRCPKGSSGLTTGWSSRSSSASREAPIPQDDPGGNGDEHREQHRRQHEEPGGAHGARVAALVLLRDRSLER